MAVSSAQVTVGTSATLLASDSGINIGLQVTLKNKGAAVVFIGPAGVTTGNGYELAVGEVLPRDLGPGEELYGVVATATQPVHVLISRN